MVNNPKVLILNEPTAGLDPSERIRFREILSELSKDKVIILSTHIVSDIEYVANEVLLLKEGRLNQKKSPIELLTELEGKVWEISLSEAEYLQHKASLLVVNTQHMLDHVELRVISAEQPLTKLFQCYREWKIFMCIILVHKVDQLLCIKKPFAKNIKIRQFFHLSNI